jgi:hypothetical protein
MSSLFDRSYWGDTRDIYCPPAPPPSNPTDLVALLKALLDTILRP